MGLKPSSHDPYLISGVLTNPYYHVCTSDIQSQLHVGLYVENFVFYSSDTAQEELFKTLLQEQIQVDFKVNVDYFLCTVYTWLQHADVNISVHLCQSAFTEFTDHRFSFHIANKVPNMTPYFTAPQLALFPPLTHYILIFSVKNNSIKLLLDASIGLRPAIALPLHLYWNFLPNTEMLHILNITRTQFMLSNISQVQMNTAYPSTKSPLQ